LPVNAHVVVDCLPGEGVKVLEKALSINSNFIDSDQ